MMAVPVISVLLPAYNAQRYLAEAVASVLAQTFPDFELIVIDDGSTDHTLEILRTFAGKDSRIKIISRPNTGIVGALNDGLSQARGDFIARMDADDICLPERFAKQVEYLKNHAEISAVGSRVLVIDPYGMELFSSEHQLTHEEIDAAVMAGNGWAIVHPATMIRAGVLRQLGGYRPAFNFLEDVDLFLRMAEISRLANLPEVLLKYRQHPQSVTKTKVELQARLWDQALREAHQRRGISPAPDWRFTPKPPPPPQEQLRSWAWRALNHGKRNIARRHALAALRLEPMNKESWRVLLCAIRGH